MDCNANDNMEVKFATQLRIEIPKSVFVREFVDRFQEYYNEYYKRLKEKISKPGKWADLFCRLLEGSNPGTPYPNKINIFVPTTVIITIIMASGTKYNRHELKKNTKKLYEYKDNPEQVRKILEEAAELIFERFKGTFDGLTCNKSPHRAMEKLACDSVERIINFYKNNPDEPWSAETMLNGVIFGCSKRGYISRGKTVSDIGGKRINTNIILKAQAQFDYTSTERIQRECLRIQQPRSETTSTEKNYEPNSKEMGFNDNLKLDEEKIKDVATFIQDDIEQLQIILDRNYKDVSDLYNFVFS